MRILHDYGDEEALEKLLLVRVLLNLVVDHVDFVIKCPEGNELALREPSVREVHLELDPVQDLLDVDKSCSDIPEEATRASIRIIDDFLVNLHVETDQLHVGADSRINLSAIQSNHVVLFNII